MKAWVNKFDQDHVASTLKNYFPICHRLRSFLFLKNVFVYLKVWVTEIKRQREIFHSLVHSPDGHISQDWASPKPRARSFPGICHMDAKSPNSLSISSVVFSKTLARSWISIGAVGTWNSAQIKQCQYHRQHPYLLCHNASPMGLSLLLLLLIC